MIVNGEKYRMINGGISDVEPGDLLYGRNSRRAYRVIHIDGDDAILRNMRHPDLLEAMPVEGIGEFYCRMELVSGFADQRACGEGHARGESPH